MALRVSTVDSDVFISDLGIWILHPTNDRDLTAEFDSYELKNSADLTAAIQAGDLLVDDGQFLIDGSDYDPAEVVNQDLNLKLDSRFVSHGELSAGKQDTTIYDGVFPVTVSSTATSTRNVYVPTARWGTWSISAGDIVVISGSDAAGVYIVESVTDSQNFIVVESIVDSTGGTCTVYHPPASTIIGVDSTSLDYSDGNTLQEVLEDLNTVSGVAGLTVSGHRELDQLVHSIAEDSHEEITYSGIWPIALITYTNSSKTTKIREEQYTWGGFQISSMVTIQYDSNGNEVERLEETYTYSGIKPVGIDREYT